MEIEEREEAKQLNITYSYPNNPNYTYEPRLEITNIDEDKVYNIFNEGGFIISGVQSSLKKDLKNPNGIYSLKFGQGLDDINPFDNRWRCECGYLKQRIHRNQKCPYCGSRVKYVDDDLNIFGWIVVKDYYLIHPNLFKSLSSYIGKKAFMKIIGYEEKKDQDGHKIRVTSVKDKDNPYAGIGMIDFKDNFEEIMQFYYQPKKQEKYDHIMKNKEKVFTQSIPVDQGSFITVM